MLMFSKVIEVLIRPQFFFLHYNYIYFPDNDELELYLATPDPEMLLAPL